MGLFIWDVEPSKIFLGDTPISKVFLWDTQIRPSKVPALCFTAEQANVSIKLHKNNNPREVSFETSTNWTTWSDYTAETLITLTNLGDKLYIRNKSLTPTGFSWSSSNFYVFQISGQCSCSWDVNYLLCKNSTDTLTENYTFYKLFNWADIISAPELTATTLTDYCYSYMFNGSELVTPPSLSATDLADYCYNYMFGSCRSLTWVPRLPALTLKSGCYWNMFRSCSAIKLSTTQDSNYTQPYRIPTEWTWTTASGALAYMLYGTWWTFTSTPTVNTTYYLHKDNTIV